MVRRAKFKLNRNALVAANKAVGNRQLHPTSPADAAARKAWMDTYLRVLAEIEGKDSGGDESTTDNAAVDQACQPCGPKWCRVQYLDAYGRGVPNATYHLFANARDQPEILEFTGQLDGNGCATHKDLHNYITHCSVHFDNDPNVAELDEPKRPPSEWKYENGKPMYPPLEVNWNQLPSYAPQIGPLPASIDFPPDELPSNWEKLFEEKPAKFADNDLPGMALPNKTLFANPFFHVTGSWLDDVQKWWKPVILGDWVQDTEVTVGQIATRAGITMIPIIDQIADISDIAANVKAMIFDGKYKDPWTWFNFFTTLIGCIPGAGSALKGLLRAFGRKAGKWVSPAWEAILAHINHFTKKVPGGVNAVKWISQKMAKLVGDFKDKAVKIAQRLFEEAEKFLNKFAELAAGVWEAGVNFAKRAVENIKAFIKSIPTFFQQIANRLKNQTDEVVEESKGFRKQGDGITADAEKGPVVQQSKAEISEGPRGKPGELSDDVVNLASEQRTKHILYGDETGGGHLWPGKPGKTPFPEDWTPEKIMEELSDIVTDPKSNWVRADGKTGYFYNSGRPARGTIIAERDGVKIKVVFEPEGEGIITAFPIN